MKTSIKITFLLTLLFLVACSKENQDLEEVKLFAAASLKNTMEEIINVYEEAHPKINIILNTDSSGTLQKQIEEGAEVDIFFSAASKQMNELDKKGFIESDSITNLLNNRIVLIKPAGGTTLVESFETLDKAKNIALAGEDVPVGQYSRELFENLGIKEKVLSKEINEGQNVTAVLMSVKEGSNEVGIVYKTDAASLDGLEIIDEAKEKDLTAAVYPIAIVKDKKEKSKEVKDFFKYITTNDQARDVFIKAGFQVESLR